MEKDRNDRGNSSNQRKKLSYAKEHIKGRKFRVVRPENRSKYLESDNTAINAVLGTITGGHHDAMRSFSDTVNYPNTQVNSTVDDPDKVRQMQKARFIQQQLESEQITSSYDSCYDYSEESVKTQNSDTYGTQPNISGTKPEHNEAGVSNENAKSKGISDDPIFVDRYRKAQFIRESLLRESKAAAFAAYDTDDHAENIYDTHESMADRCSNSNEDTYEQSLVAAEPTNSISVALSAAPVITDDIKQYIIRGIKSAHFKDRLEERRREQAVEKTEESPTLPLQYMQAYHHNSDENDDSHGDITSPIDAAASYISTVQSGNAQTMVAKPVTDIMKHHMGEGAAVTDSIKQTANSVASSDSMQAVPFNIGMILAENEGKKLAYKIAKGEDILAEKEQVRVQERMAQSKYHFVEPDKHVSKVEKRETIQQEQKRRFIKSTENKKAEVRREAEHKAKENIYLKANRKENGLIGKIFGDDKKNHTKGKGAVIAGAAAAVIPILLMVVIVMFICALFSWASPYKEKLFDDSSMSYKEKELSGEKVITGYIDLIKDIYDEKQLDILARIAMMGCDHEMLDNRWIKLDENFDIESIIAIEAAKKWREIQDSMKDSEENEEPVEISEEDAEDIIYHLTREDFEEVVELTFNFDARAETKTCDLCDGEETTVEDPDTGETDTITTPCVHKFLMGSGVNNLVSIAGHDGGEYYFFDQVFDKDSETYEEDKMMYDLYREALQKQFIGTTGKPSHTIVDYSGYGADYQRMLKVAEAHGYEINGDEVKRIEEGT